MGTNQIFSWLSALIRKATRLHVENIGHSDAYDVSSIQKIPLPPGQEQPLPDFLSEYQLSFEEQVILLLALAPHFAPQILDIFMAKNPNFDAICTEFGGVLQPPHRGVIPTGETAVFLLAGRDQQLRSQIASLLLPDQPLHRHQLLRMETAKAGQPFLSGRLIADEELLQKLMFGQVQLPTLSTNFPATRLETGMDWEDLVLPPNTLDQLKDLENWLLLHEELQKHPVLGKRTKPGYRALFYGPPGTGKTLTASLLGKSTGRPVFRIDLSMVVSKYIGETEKNLSRLFEKAEHKDWILFFDEADSLFSKRTGTESSNDRFANQEVSYLLQRIEGFNGMAILASNLKQNIDPAFMRRFQAIVNFPHPGLPERKLIWSKHLPEDLSLQEDISLEKLAKNYELTASQINNIVQACFIESRSRREKGISRDTLRRSMQKELGKQDLIFEVLF